eukprot:1666836-Pyramimonas_sp.AAC.1
MMLMLMMMMMMMMMMLYHGNGHGAILGVLNRLFGDSGLSWAVLRASRGPVAPCWASLGLGKVMREHSGGPRGRAASLKRFESLGSGSIMNPQA